ncbi:MAG: Gfo/Idh/MocA family oxidoreductase, partial [Verrucomicrobiota bacterium]
MSKPHNVGVIGYGWAAGAHIEAINNTTNGQVTAVYSSRPLDAAEVTKTHGGAPIKVYNNIADLIADPDIDVVDVTSFPTQHKDQAIAVAEAGKHLILEKPITLNRDDAHAVKSAIDAAGVRTCVCFELRFISQFQTITSILDEGLIGDLHYGEIDYYHGVGPWYGQYRWNTTKEQGGSSLLSAGCHALDALLLCMGTDVEEVTALNAQSSHEIFAKYEYPTTTAALLKFKSGKVGKCASVIDCFQPYYFHT